MRKIYILSVHFVETWLVIAQVLSTREFSEVFVRRFVGAMAPYIELVFIAVGLIGDVVAIGLPISVGTIGVIFVGIYTLHTPREERIFWSIILLFSTFFIEVWRFGLTNHVWSAWGLFFGIVVITPMTMRWIADGIGLFLSYVFAVWIDVIFQQQGNHPLWASAEMAVMAAVIMGIYIEFRLWYERRNAQAWKDVTFDELTGALTRRGLVQWLDDGRRGKTGMILFCDIDNFKWVNDTWGHDVGDRILYEFAERVQQHMASVDGVLARFGGDEFQIWICCGGKADDVACAEGIHRAVTEVSYVVRKDLALKVGVSIGYAIGILDQDTATAADYALLKAKVCGKNCVVPAETPDMEVATTVAMPHSRTPEIHWLVNMANLLWEDTENAYILTDAEGTILALNEQYSRLSGRSEKELLGKKPAVNSAKETPFAAYRALWGALSKRLPWRGILLNERPDGTRWWELAELSPISQYGQTVGYWGMMRDAAKTSVNQFVYDEKTVTGQFWHGTIEWVFQPIVDITKRDVAGYEALARPYWENIAVSPQTFFDLAEQMGMRILADFECLESLLHCIANNASFWNEKRLFINLYAGTLFYDQRIVDWVHRLKMSVPSLHCVFEFLESHVDELTCMQFAKMRELLPDVEWAQDDFGAGERDVIRLVTWWPHWLKLDRTLIEQAMRNQSLMEFIAFVQTSAVQRNTRIICEGIETIEQAQCLRTLGLHFEQGYMWSVPLTDPSTYLLPDDLYIS